MQFSRDTSPHETLSVENSGASWEMSDELSQYQDVDSNDHSSATPKSLFMASVPSQLHPAVSLGMKRVSSCYFSIGTDEDELSSLGYCNDLENESSYGGEWNNDSVNLFYHDTLMIIFTYLDFTSLAAFSETARRPNFEVFYFLQLQLQRALLPFEKEQNLEYDGDNLFSISGVSIVSRLAKLDPSAAEDVVNDYLQSNSTLGTMPLSHSMEYMRHFLQRNRAFCRQVMMSNHNSSAPSAKAVASAAFMLTLVGAAYMTTGTADGTLFETSFGTELPNMLFRFGFMGSLMGAARQISDTEQRQAMRKKAEQMAQTMQEQFSNSQGKNNFSFPSLMEMKRMINTMLSVSLGNNSTKEDIPPPILPNPYDHLPEEKKEDDNSSRNTVHSNHALVQEKKINYKIPSGCVGAYSRAIQKATKYVCKLVKEKRRNRLLALSEEEQRRRSLDFIDACSSDESLNLVKEMVNIIDVDCFYTIDGSKTCALFNAAFNGASSVIEYLCEGIADENKGKDGGLCDVNMRDSDGWTAMHYAAGNNQIEAIRALASQPTADLSIEANNGWTPLQWANRLSNKESSDLLKALLSEKQNKNHQTSEVTGPLKAVAQTVFSFMP